MNAEEREPRAGTARDGREPPEPEADTARPIADTLRAAVWGPPSALPRRLPVPGSGDGARPLLGGVCAGIARRRGWRPWTVRLLAILLVLPMALYPVVWLVGAAGRPPESVRGRANRQLLVIAAAAAVSLLSAPRLMDLGLTETSALIAGLAVGLPLLALPRSPLLSWRLMTPALVLMLFLLWTLPEQPVASNGPFPAAGAAAYLLVLFIVASQYDRRVVLVVGACATALTTVHTAVLGADAAPVVWSVVLVLAVLIAGDNVRLRREAAGAESSRQEVPPTGRPPIPLWDDVLDAVWRTPARPAAGRLRLPRGPVRPIGERVIAGVCGAFARGSLARLITFRLLFCLFLPLSAAVYLLLWLLLPLEGRPSPATTLNRDAPRHSAYQKAIAWFLLFGVGAGVAALAAVQTVDFLGMAVAPSVVLGIVTGLPLALLPYSPLLTWRFMTAGLFAVLVASAVDDGSMLSPTAVGGIPPGILWPWPIAVLVVLPLVLYLVAIGSSGRLTAGVGAVTVLLGILPASVFAGTPPLQALWISAVAVAVLAFGHTVRGRRTAQRELAHESALRRQDRARQAVLEERSRIARELHDVVSHHMSMIAIQAEAAPYKDLDLSPDAAATFHALRDTARDALAEMRRVVGLLREDDEDAERVPQPGLAQLDDLVAGAREAGMTVELEVAGLPGDLPGSVDLSAYRIVQESLSNAGRHAAGAHVRIGVEGGPGLVTLRIANGPAGASTPGPGLEPGGHGLVGMRERVAMLGGSLRAGPLPGGGFEVVAELPVPGED
ncbi:signal transduction histidine kinase/phage shock protein PspC (stress-responsive transcriptional regulator) [Spinactinospora alkalitolerans]|uniref:histidine kinase n=1 Tax=Spinactinospora alkalitolerans TaxID=687207 RepID=A0A852TN45_9ACTN|nr:histidine kinase [Spinactinospora alkalitolerans]NYE45746.1 signal transduction histidine kinase/phage shock protein PspC (stress-responsive transcriptional regulator) [Spinactinospora alkalitolerans]